MRDLSDEELRGLVADAERLSIDDLDALDVSRMAVMAEEILRRRAEPAAFSTAPMPPGLDERLMVRRREAQVEAERALLTYTSTVQPDQLDVEEVDDMQCAIRTMKANVRRAVDALLTAREAARAVAGESEKEGDDE